MPAMPAIATGPDDRACIAPLPDCQAPSRSTNRATLRCGHCHLNQFVPSDRKCRRCRCPLDPPVDIVPVTVTATAPAPDPEPLIPVAVCPMFHTLEQSLPVVLLWLRLRAGMSQREFASALGRGSRTYASKIENGRTLPTVRSLIGIAGALGVPVQKIVMMCEGLMADDSKKNIPCP